MAGLLSFAPIRTPSPARATVEPDTPPASAQLERAIVLYRTGQTKAAIALLQNLVGQCADDVDAHYCLAKALYNARLLNEAAQKAPLGELVDIDDVGFACAYLATDFGRRITGGTIYVDGGANIVA